MLAGFRGLFASLIVVGEVASPLLLLVMLVGFLGLFASLIVVGEVASSEPREGLCCFSSPLREPRSAV